MGTAFVLAEREDIAELMQMNLGVPPLTGTFSSQGSFQVSSSDTNTLTETTTDTALASVNCPS